MNKATNYCVQNQSVKSPEDLRKFCSNIAPIFEQDQPMQITTDFATHSVFDASNILVSTRSNPSVPQGLSVARKDAPHSSI